MTLFSLCCVYVISWLSHFSFYGLCISPQVAICTLAPTRELCSLKANLNQQLYSTNISFLLKSIPSFLERAKGHLARLCALIYGHWNHRECLETDVLRLISQCRMFWYITCVRTKTKMWENIVYIFISSLVYIKAKLCVKHIK